jgi:hypothetical protein
MKVGDSETTFISFARKINMIPFVYKHFGFCTNGMDTVKYLGIIDTKLYFHHYVDCICSQALKLLGLIRVITFPFIHRQTFHVIFHIS